MKIVSWNVAGINACVKKGLIEFIKKENAEVYCFQEVKANAEKLPDEIKNISGYHLFTNPAEKPGYSGVLVLSKIKPLQVINKFEEEILNGEGRVLVLEFDKFFLINAYFPHSHRELIRLDFKLKFNRAFLNLCEKLEKMKPILIASDFNVAHKEIDLKNAKPNKGNAGFTIQEREWFGSFLNRGFVDTFRMFNSEGGNYTWWTYMNNARERNIGWRIDYFVVSEKLKSFVKNSVILKDVYGSDHCPIELEIDK
ncbi:MAG: exodeoxyribonuclease III [Nanoarchaeota archaeon]|mgnify:CR=1 FL=1